MNVAINNSPFLVLYHLGHDNSRIASTIYSMFNCFWLSLLDVEHFIFLHNSLKNAAEIISRVVLQLVRVVKRQSLERNLMNVPVLRTAIDLKKLSQ